VKTCESCRRRPGTRRVKLGGVTFVVCSGCAPDGEGGVNVYPAGLDAGDRRAWVRMLAAHRVCVWSYTWSRERQASVRQCLMCGAEEIARSVVACRVRVTATVVAEGVRRALPAHPLALPAAPSVPAWPVNVPRVAEGAA
jgi:hypothetical protein